MKKLVAGDGNKYRRVVASPLPKYVPDVSIIRFLVKQGVIVVCAGGGGIPVICRPDGSLVGIEAVIDKDRAAELLARHLGAEALLMLTDVDAVIAIGARRVSGRSARQGPMNSIRKIFPRVRCGRRSRLRAVSSRRPEALPVSDGLRMRSPSSKVAPAR